MQERIITIDEQATLLQWAGERLGIASWVADSVALGLLDADGRIVAVAVFNMFHDQGAWMHMVTDHEKNWATRAQLRTAFEYAFGHRRLRRLSFRIPIYPPGHPLRPVSMRAQITAIRLGASVEGREREGFHGHDVAIYGMMHHECVWIPPADDADDEEEE